MPETLGSSADMIRLQGVLGTADRPVQLVFLNPSAVETLGQARKRVRTADAKARRSVIGTLSERMGQMDEVTEIWLVAEEPQLVVALVVRDLSLDRELEMRAIFADITRDYDAEFRIYSEAEARADLARIGARLHG